MSAELLGLSLHASEYPAARRASLLTALWARRLPGKLLYQSPAQAQRWLAYHAAWAPSRTDAELRAHYGAAYAAAAAALAPGPALLVGLGCGGGSKDAALLERLGQADPARALHYAPLDASAALVAEAALLARERCPGVGLHPLLADLAAAPALAAWLDAAAPGAARVYSCFGMLPNQDALAFPAWLAGLLRPGDALLVSANLSPRGLAMDGARILLQYDNPPARAWYAGALSELGLPASAYVLRVAARPLERGELPGLPPGAAWRVTVQAVLNRSTAIAVQGETVPLAVGERLAVFHSLRFTAEAALALLAAAGLRVAERWVGAGGEEGVFLCGRP